MQMSGINLRYNIIAAVTAMRPAECNECSVLVTATHFDGKPHV